MLQYTDYTSAFLGCGGFFLFFFTFYLAAMGVERTQLRLLTAETHAQYVCTHMKLAQGYDGSMPWTLWPSVCLG